VLYMFNREYQRRAAAQGLQSLGIGLAKDEASGFYRPARRVSAGKRCKKSSGPLQGIQLELFADPPDARFYRPSVIRDSGRPLADLFPEAYEQGR
jgi:hypothetical protein